MEAINPTMRPSSDFILDWNSFQQLPPLLGFLKTAISDKIVFIENRAYFVP